MSARRRCPEISALRTRDSVRTGAVVTDLVRITYGINRALSRIGIARIVRAGVLVVAHLKRAEIRRGTGTVNADFAVLTFDGVKHASSPIGIARIARARILVIARLKSAETHRRACAVDTCIALFTIDIVRADLNGCTSTVDADFSRSTIEAHVVTFSRIAITRIVRASIVIIAVQKVTPMHARDDAVVDLASVSWGAVAACGAEERAFWA